MKLGTFQVVHTVNAGSAIDAPEIVQAVSICTGLTCHYTPWNCALHTSFLYEQLQFGRERREYS